MSQLRDTKHINEIIIHCSATPNGASFVARDIDQWHAKRGFTRDPKLAQYSPFKHIGYHFVIRPNGAVESGRRLDETGAHCLGHNQRSIGICLVGTDAYSLRQWEALKGLVTIEQAKFPNLKIMGHRDTSPDTNHNGKADPQEWLKTCPGFNVSDWLDGGMRPLIEHLLDAPDAPLNP